MLNRVLTCSIVALAASATAVYAGPWSMPSGSTATYTYSNGQDLNGHVGDPSLTSAGFQFFPSSLTAIQQGGVGTQSTNDIVSVILNAKPNQQFSTISANLLGDYAITGLGSIDVMSAIKVTNLATNQQLSQMLTIQPTVPVVTATATSGAYTGLGNLALPEGWTSVRIDFDTTVFAGALGGTSIIDTKAAAIGVSTEAAVVPLPTALAVAPLAMGLVAWARRRTKA